MIFDDKTLNNIVNFCSSYLVFQILTNEELQNEFYIFIFHEDRKEVMQDIDQTMMAGKNSHIDTEFIYTRKYLASKLKEFVEKKHIDNHFSNEIEILQADTIESLKQIQKIYKLSLNRAQKIYYLYKSLF